MCSNGGVIPSVNLQEEIWDCMKNIFERKWNGLPVAAGRGVRVGETRKLWADGLAVSTWATRSEEQVGLLKFPLSLRFQALLSK